MRVVKFSQYLKENLDGIELKYYAFDVDDNLLHLPTVIHMDKMQGGDWIPVDLSTSDFAKYRGDKENYRIRNNNGDEAFCEFRDFGPRGDNAFLLDAKQALESGDMGPSWDAFIKCLSDGSIFSIITARGQDPNSLKKGVELIIDDYMNEDEQSLLYANCLKHAYLFRAEGIDSYDRIPKGRLSRTPLVQLYLDNCDFYGVSSPSFMKEFGEGSGPANPEKSKEMALDRFIDKCNSFGQKIGAKSVSIGFSDDDPKNVNHVRQYFHEKSGLAATLAHAFKLNLYDTSNRKLKGGEVTRFRAVQESNFSVDSPDITHSTINSGGRAPAGKFQRDPATFSEFRKSLSQKIAKPALDELKKKRKKKI